MKHFYSIFSRTLLLAGLLVAGRAGAQIQGVTTISGSGNCSNVVADFNTDDDDFNSPSLYYGNSSFYFNSAQGWWSEVDGVHSVPPIPGGGGMRLVSIISPLYRNPNPVGVFDVGFHYIVPDPAVNRFQVRIISATPQGSYTVYNVEATTDFQFFSAYSTTPTAYTGGAPQVSGMEGNICIRLLDDDITNAPGVAYRVEVTYEVAEPQFTVFDDLSVGAAAPAPLPVTFMGMLANKVDNGVQVKWDVGDEVNVQEYQLEKSTDGASFNTVGTIASNHKNVYSLTDRTVSKSPSVYYRVKSVDLDGRFKYSGIIRVKNGSSYSDAVTIYPLPARNQITISHNQLGNRAKLVISTMDGKVMKVVTPGVGVSNTMVDISSFGSGMYLVRLDDGNGKIESKTFIKQ